MENNKALIDEKIMKMKNTIVTSTLDEKMKSDMVKAIDDVSHISVNDQNYILESLNELEFMNNTMIEKVGANQMQNDNNIEKSPDFRFGQDAVDIFAKKEDKTKEYEECRNKVNHLYDQDDNYVFTEFNFKENGTITPTECDFSVQLMDPETKNVRTHKQQFECNKEFMNNMFQPSVTDYARRCPITDVRVMPNNQNPRTDTSDFVATSENNNNILKINNVDATYAKALGDNIRVIEPDLFNRRRDEKLQKETASRLENRPFQKVLSRDVAKAGYADVALSVVMIASILVLTICTVLFSLN